MLQERQRCLKIYKDPPQSNKELLKHVVDIIDDVLELLQDDFLNIQISENAPSS